MSNHPLAPDRDAPGGHAFPSSASVAHTLFSPVLGNKRTGFLKTSEVSTKARLNPSFWFEPITQVFTSCDRLTISPLTDQCIGGVGFPREGDNASATWNGCWPKIS
ncbi:MAG: hypothetical protein VW491_10995, partial [Gammaproteobacteria bacterium]